MLPLFRVIDAVSARYIHEHRVERLFKQCNSRWHLREMAIDCGTLFRVRHKTGGCETRVHARAIRLRSPAGSRSRSVGHVTSVTATPGWPIQRAYPAGANTPIGNRRLLNRLDFSKGTKKTLPNSRDAGSLTHDTNICPVQRFNFSHFSPRNALTDEPRA